MIRKLLIHINTIYNKNKIYYESSSERKIIILLWNNYIYSFRNFSRSCDFVFVFVFVVLRFVFHSWTNHTSRKKKESWCMCLSRDRKTNIIKKWHKWNNINATNIYRASTDTIYIYNDDQKVYTRNNVVQVYEKKNNNTALRGNISLSSIKSKNDKKSHSHALEKKKWKKGGVLEER